MLHDVAPGLLLGALALGAVHGAEPGHGWPIAAAYAFDRTNAWLSGLVAGLVIGVGHLISSLAVVLAFFLLKAQLNPEGLNESLRVAGVQIGSPVGVVAGVLLLLLAVREYRGGGHSHGGDGHSHGDGHGHGGGHSHDETKRTHEHDGDATGPGRLHDAVSVTAVEGDDGPSEQATPDEGRSHGHGSLSADEGLSGIAVSAFVLGFAHEEEFEIIAICAGSDHCLGLMLAYALTVVGVITALTLALVAGYERFEERMERYAEHFPTVSAAVLGVMGVGFLLGVF
ncbi:hypothetical protein [Halorarum halobium]|uniref:hypothetical protein n=1 Tax=Halorarum halobium TaxID=3075121 RepID=UPI0028B1FEB9|nr:hypothetical protein [Halobaculum sp. XH14]